MASGVFQIDHHDFGLEDPTSQILQPTSRKSPIAQLPHHLLSDSFSPSSVLDLRALAYPAGSPAPIAPAVPPAADDEGHGAAYQMQLEPRGGAALTHSAL
ncbi:hypothetical protein E2562_026734 [Oryza meyeriana var. granulata]|uniref:Uncharacterized protein n=1 Tax=Oryza meyeriana var. granulata TaxID=110450 RepID=A0A6G1EZA8_9ORYZ|nr:hypothetical protein E2562_026734 [Oryza meyeriana var. granulata]